MEAERAAVAAAIEAVGATPIWFERFGGRDDDAEAAYLAELGTCDVYVGVLGEYYGRLLPTRFSATHTEYLEAEHRGLRICVWATAKEDWDGHQQRFLDDIRTFHTTNSYRDPADLQARVETRLRGLAAEELSPWCKIGNAIVRATRASWTAAQIEITTTVRDPGVLAYLESLRSIGWQRADVWVTIGNTAQFARVVDVTTTVTNRQRADLIIQLEILDPPSTTAMRSSTGTHTADEIDELAVRNGLFHEHHEPGGMAFLAAMDDPLDPLRQERISEEILEPIVQLVITEALVSNGRGNRLLELRVGRAVNGKRALHLSWQSVAQYSNQAPPVHSIEGHVDL